MGGGKDIPVVYSNHLFLQLFEGEVLLTFGRADLPLEAISPEVHERMRTEGIPVVVVARLIIPALRVKPIIDAFTGLYQNLQQAQVPVIHQPEAHS